jgi:CRP/FNR family transcriptional regulator, dissimilatory nitrate respiration regulator
VPLSPLFIESIKKLILFSALDESQLQKIVSSSQIRPLKSGDNVFKQGEISRHFYAVHKGSIKLSLLSPDGCEKVIEIVRPGQQFAEAIMFYDNPVYPVNCIALEASEVFEFDNKTYLKILEESFVTNRRLLQYMSRKMHGFLREIDNLCLHTATYRLINYLICSIPDDIQSNSTEITLDAAKNVIAKRLSIQGETFSRILRDLRKKDLIEVSGNKVLIKDIIAMKSHLT